MLVHLRISPEDFDDLEFDSFSGLILALEGMQKSLLNTDWLIGPMSDDERQEALDCIDSMIKMFTPLYEKETRSGVIELTGDPEGSQ